MQRIRSKKSVSACLTFFAAVFLLIVPFLTIFIVGTATPPQYAQTYYGELAQMYARLKETRGKKIVIVGNSNVAFGVDSALAERLLGDAGLDYAVCNFGLYGALGTKMMLEIADDHIGNGDIVILAPEIDAQFLSLYFSAAEAWLALDSDFGMFGAFSAQTKGNLVGAFPAFASKKFCRLQSGETARPSGVYARSSFDAHCDLKNFGRPFNMLVDGVDANNPIYFDVSLYQKDFIEYVNEFCAQTKKRGAAMYYSFPPMNREAVAAEPCEYAAFYDFVCASFDFPVISDIEDYIMDKEWFYDSNYHLNESGMAVRTVRLVNDIKNQLGNTSKTEYVLPEKPIIPQEDIEGEGNNCDAEQFTYERDGNYYIVTGLTQSGARRKELTIAYQVDGLYVKSFLPSVFAGNEIIESITIQENIRSISDNSFSGCANLKKIVLKHTEPWQISVGYGLLNGTSSALYLPGASVGAFKNNYFWGHYADKIFAAETSG